MYSHDIDISNVVNYCSQLNKLEIEFGTVVNETIMIQKL